MSLGATSLGALAACRERASRPVSKRLPLIGYVGAAIAEGPQMTATREGLQALGYREGQTIQIKWRFADNDAARRPPAIARELVGLHPDVIVARPTPMVQSLLHVTRKIPIVIVLPEGSPGQSISQGLIKSQARPGGNVTGLLGGAPTFPGKRMNLLHESLPGATRLATLRDSGFPGDRYLPYPEWTSHVISLSVSGPEELEGVFARFEQEHAELVAVDSRTRSGSDYSDEIAEQTRRHRLPAIGDGDTFARSGGLMSYASNRAALYRGAGRYVDKILKGANPADLPVELPTIFSFVINKATADAIGLTIPPAVLAQATEVLQ
jgi:putative ABC transport system substrate-binding protein